MREGDVASTELVHLANTGDAAPDLVAALDANHAGDAAGFEGSPRAGRVVAVLKLGGVFGDEALGDVDLLEGVADDPLGHVKSVSGSLR